MNPEASSNSVLNRIFYSQNPDETKRDPNNPADSAYFNAQAKIRKASYAKWYGEHGGEYVIKYMEERLVACLIELATCPISMDIIALKQKILDYTMFIDEVHNAFVENNTDSK